MRNIDYQDDQRVFSYINETKNLCVDELIEFLVENNLPLRERWAFYLLGKRGISKTTIQYMDYDSYDTYGGYVFGEIYHWVHYLRNEKEKKEVIEGFMRQELFEKKNKKKLEIHQSELKEIEREIAKLGSVFIEEKRIMPFNVITFQKREAKSEERPIEKKISELESLLCAKIQNMIDFSEDEMKEYDISKDKVHKRYIKEGWDYVLRQVDDDCDFEIYRLAKEANLYEISNYDDEETNDFCEACQESPCMCSDREKTSLTSDY